MMTVLTVAAKMAVEAGGSVLLGKLTVYRRENIPELLQKSEVLGGRVWTRQQSSIRWNVQSQ